MKFSILTFSIKCHFAEYRYVECQDYLNVMLSVIMLNIVMLSVVMLNIVMLSVIMLNVVTLSVVALILGLIGHYQCNIHLGPVT
jgi:hypothetical protein